MVFRHAPFPRKGPGNQQQHQDVVPINSYLQRGDAVPGPVWVRSKWLLAFPRVPVTPGTYLTQTIFFTELPPERMQKGSTQSL